jgi:hypothetical protein
MYNKQAGQNPLGSPLVRNPLFEKLPYNHLLWANSYVTGLITPSSHGNALTWIGTPE